MIDQAITMFLSGNFADQCVEALKTISSSTRSADKFVRALIARKVEAGADLDTILPEVQHLLERVAEQSESTASIFMAYLWPLASLRIGMHDVSDSIDLWLTNQDRSEIIEHLRYIATTADSEAAREHFRQLIAR